MRKTLYHRLAELSDLIRAHSPDDPKVEKYIAENTYPDCDDDFPDIAGLLRTLGRSYAKH